jgi:hypothetical protein
VFRHRRIRCQQSKDCGIGYGAYGEKIKYDIDLDVFNAMRFALKAKLNR